jgi:AcrR family transcriptional regulator
LTVLVSQVYNLNMFKSAATYKRSVETRARILSTALATFRRVGLDAATMRQISKDAGVALGAAYYYFPSKEAIVQAFYDSVQEEHRQRVEVALAIGGLDLEARLRVALHSKLDILEGGRKFLGALFRYTGEPGHPLSVLSDAARAVREQSIAVFALAVGDEKLPDDIRAFLPTALWALHMAILLYFIYDPSPNQRRTRKLVDGAIALVVRALALAKFPLLKPVRGSLFSLLRDAGLFSEHSPIPLEE